MNALARLGAIAAPLRNWCRRAANVIRTRIIADYHATNLARARTTIAALVRDGWHVGPVPYGYRAVRVRVTTASGRHGIRVRLAVDPFTGPVVQLIFHWRVHEHLGYAAIARRLAADPEWCPPPTNLRTAGPGLWSKSAVRTIQNNPVYTGRTVWGRTHRGHPLPPTEWIVSDPGAHPALVDDSTFTRAGGILLPAAQHRRSAA